MSKETVNPFSSRRSVRLISIGAVLISICFLSVYLFSKKVDLSHCASRIQQEIYDSETRMSAEMDLLESLPAAELKSYLSDRRTFYEANGLSFFIKDNDDTEAWSTNAVPEIDLLGDFVESGPCILLRNGYYIIHERKSDSRVVHGLFLIKYEYNYQNRYLINNYPSFFGLHAAPRITFLPSEPSIAIHSTGHQEIFYLTSSERQDTMSSLLLWVIACFLGFYLLLKGLFAACYTYNSSLITLAVLMLCLLGLRAITLFLPQLEVFRSLPGFSPEIYASSALFPSINDFLINAFLLFQCSYFGFLWARDRAERILPFGLLVLLTAAYLVYGHYVNELFIQLIKDSVLNFNISNFFDLNGFSMIGIISLGFLLLSVFYAARSISIFYHHDSPPVMRARWIVLALMGVVLVILYDFNGVVDMVLVLWAIVLLTLAVLFQRERGQRLVFTQVVLGLVVITFYSAYMFEKYVSIKDRNNLEVLAGRILDGTDSDAEYRFMEFKEELAADSILWKKEFSNYHIDEVKEYLSQHYFKGFWTHYDVHVSLFGPDSLGYVRSHRSTQPSRAAMEASVHDWRQFGSLSELSKVERSDHNVNYILRKILPENQGHVYIELALRIIPEELGFPELLLEREDMFEEELSDYSIAEYRSGRLVAQHGDYDYKTEAHFVPLLHGKTYFEENGYTHYPFSRGEDMYVISGESKTTMGHITTFTYLFSMFGFMMLIGLIIERLIVGRTTMVINLQNKIQMLIIGIVIASLFIFGFGAYYYIISQHQEKNENLLSEKVESVLIELSHKLEKEKAINDQDKLELYLAKFSNVFFTDINLFDLEGQLMASSRPQLFNKGVISTRMDPQAFLNLSEQKESKYIHEESIGRLEYLSAYVPFRNSQNEILAYLNLPYFAKQNELEDELSAFVVAVVNILVVLFALSTIVALIFSNWITRPLKILQENLASIRLGQTNRPIEYAGTDEIASLVHEYNSKVKELEENAEVLAKSERESAWREMAKQVAHEIKNPLTPMKLSIQYLQRSWADGSEDWDDKFKRSSNTLIEQIDTLSGIASAFSDFAQMPSAAKEPMNLTFLLEQAVDLFAGHADIEVTFQSERDSDDQIMADKDQMTRLFNNLIKNAVQSIPEEQEGRVVVELIVKGFNYIIEVRDNGVGIPEEMHDKIFVPNFTTKTTGTGLGLAMCKNIVESAGGEMWFRSKVDAGTSFFVSLPKLDV